MDTVTCFIDTSALLAYKGINQINWTKELGAARVQVIVPLVVIRELNVHKDGRKDKEKSKRAGTILKLLFRLFEEGDEERTTPLGHNGYLVAEHRDPPVLHPWNRDIPDDQFIANALLWAEEYKHPVTILTRDQGMMLKVKAAKIGLTKLSDSNLVQEGPYESDAHVKALEDKIRKLEETPRPKLSVTFADGLSTTVVVRKNTILQQLSSGPVSVTVVPRIPTIHDLLGNEAPPEQAHGIIFEIENTGSQGATDYRVEVEFPAGITLWQRKVFPLLSGPANVMIRESPDGRQSAIYQGKSLLHGLTRTTETLFLIFDENASFELKWTARAYNMPVERAGSLKIVQEQAPPPMSEQEMVSDVQKFLDGLNVRKEHEDSEEQAGD